MLIQCTKKLLEQLKIKPEACTDENPLFSWHANLLTLNRRKTVVFVNDKTRYIIVLYGLKLKDFKKLDELFRQALCETFMDEGIEDDAIEEFLKNSGETVYCKTKNRTLVARMNNSSESVYFFQEFLDSISVCQSALSIKVNKLIVGDGKNDYITPCEEIYKELEQLCGKKIFSLRAAEMKVTLQLDEHEVWRRLIVPLNIRFDKFHEVLQRAFGWNNCHIHEYCILSDKLKNESYIPVVNLVCDAELLDNPNDVKKFLEGEKRLSEYIPEYKKIEYDYDLGDMWQHFIEIEKIHDNYSENYAVCLEGHGTTPPEDVGGETGYDIFLKTISDKKNPEYNHAMSWAASQGYKEFNLENVNKEIRSLFR